MEIPHDRGDESFADDLNMWPGIVSGRVALLLRSTEIQPAAALICPPILYSVGFSFRVDARNGAKFSFVDARRRMALEVRI